MKKILNIHLLISHNLSLIHSHLWIGSLMSRHLMTWIHLRSHMKKSTVFLSYLPINYLLLLIIWKTKLCIFKISLLNRACRTQKGDLNIKGILSTEGPLRKRGRQRNIFLYLLGWFRVILPRRKVWLEDIWSSPWIMSLWPRVAAPSLECRGQCYFYSAYHFSVTCFHLRKGGLSNAASLLKILFRAFSHSVYQKYILRSFTNTHHLVSGSLSTLLSPLF